MDTITPALRVRGGHPARLRAASRLKAPSLNAAAFVVNATVFLASVVLASVVLAAAAATTARADPARWKNEGWRTDFSKTSIDYGEILSGGPPKDGIPSIDRPKFQPVSAVTNLTANEPVVSVAIDGDARAYPIRILIWHEIVNDVVGGMPVAVTYCPLCNSAITFDRRVNGETLDFGTTGKLRNSDLVMYDRATESWWQQFTGEAIAGKMTGTSLKMLPARLESFAEFKQRHGDGQVLVPNNPGQRRYGENPYVGYDSAARPFLYNGEMPDGINPMARVVAIKMPGKTFAVSLAHLRAKKRIEQAGVILSWRPGQTSAVDTREIAKGRDVGTVNAVLADQPDQLVPYDVTFAFAFHAFHPKVGIITP